MDEIEEFRTKRVTNIASYNDNLKLKKAAAEFEEASIRAQYSYNFDWADRPIIQYPQDIVAMQELIWSVRPDLIIECGIAHGGSLIFSASMMALLEYADAAITGGSLNPTSPCRKVLGIDIDIRPHNRQMIESHPLFPHIEMVEGSSIDTSIIQRVHRYAEDFNRVLVCLDSNHTHDHVLAELEAYAPLTSVGSYCVVFDTNIERLPGDLFPDRPWDVGDNPLTAVRAYLKVHGPKAASSPAFQINEKIDQKLLVTVAPQGYLKRIR